MLLSARSRLRRWNPLPDGTTQVGAGFVVAGITSYGFLVISARALGPERYAPLSVLWAVVIVAGPGFFLPLEQEVSRAIASRRARGEGTSSVVRRAAMLGSGMAVVLLIATVATAGLSLDYLFERDVFLLLGLVLGLIGYWFSFLLRGVLSGSAQFRSYALLIGSEGLLRVAGCILLAAIGAETAGPYGLVIGLAPLLALPIVLGSDLGLDDPGPEAPWAEASHALGYLLAASVLTQLLINAAPIAVKLLSTEKTDAAAGRFLAGLVLTRVPVFLFQAVQAALLPKLSGFAGAQRVADFRSGFFRLMKLVLAVGISSTALAVLIGPNVLRIFFGEAFELGRRDLGYLAAGSALFMVALTLSQGLIALAAYRRVALGWLIGMAAFSAVTAMGSDLFLRVELGFATGCLAAAASMGNSFARELRGWEPPQ